MVKETLDNLDMFYQAMEQTKYKGTNQFAGALAYTVTRDSYEGMTRTLREPFSQIPIKKIEEALLCHIMVSDLYHRGEARDLSEKSESGIMIRLSSRLAHGDIEGVKNTLRTNEGMCVAVASSFLYERYRDPYTSKDRLNNYLSDQRIAGVIDQIQESYKGNQY